MTTPRNQREPVPVRIVTPVDDLVRRSAFWRAWAVMVHLLALIALTALALAVLVLLAAMFLGHLLD